MSSFYTGKGKGKSERAYPDENKTQSESESSDLDNDKELNKAIMLSLQQDRVGESSKKNP
jgi:hypothetical protein